MPTSTQPKVSRTRRDCSGELTSTLTALLESGAALYQQAELIASPECLASFRRMHRTWVLSCVPTLASGFEPESVSEFVHANALIPTHGDVGSATRVAIRVMRDALELLRGLCATLDYGSGD